jgi:hypothetical protein
VSGQNIKYVYSFGKCDDDDDDDDGYKGLFPWG